MADFHTLTRMNHNSSLALTPEVITCEVQMGELHGRRLILELQDNSSILQIMMISVTNCMQAGVLVNIIAGMIHRLETVLSPSLLLLLIMLQ